MTISRTCEQEALGDGRTVSVYRLAAPNGLTVRLSSLGATLVGILAPDRHGNTAPVLLGWKDVRTYARFPDPLLGATAGRFANRIRGASFEIDGEVYRLAANEGANHLHGGARGFHQRIWDAEPIDDGVRFSLASPDGEQGYPGRLHASADITLSEGDTIDIAYRATTNRSTHVNLVSHGYFNLSGQPGSSIGDHRLWVAANGYLAIDDDNIPLDRQPVANTCFDFNRPRRVGDALNDLATRQGGDGGFNHCMIVGDGRGAMRRVARLEHPDSGRALAVATDQPGLQFYTGDGLDLAVPDGDHGFGPRTGLCLEAQHFPDSPNRSDFPSTRLDPGQHYLSRTRLRFTTDAHE